MSAISFSTKRVRRAWRMLLMSAALLLHGCDNEPVPIDDLDSLCMPCGRVANGDLTISGNASIDGIFKAVGTLKRSTDSIRADFNGQVRNLAAIFGVQTEGRTTLEIVTDIETEFALQIDAYLNGGIQVDLVAPRCSADLHVSTAAQAQCEAKAGCDVDVSAECNPGELSFKCEGKCSGGCTAGCQGLCTVEAGAVAACAGTCKGACDLSAGGGCEGTCKGTCEGTCSLENTSGECEGECEGTCTGSCEMPSAGGSCEGECKGECTFEVTAEAECEGKCEGSCSGECSGGCEGNFDPPSCDAEASANCEASADCQAQAQAQASASMECTPPSIEISVEFGAGVDVSAQAETLAKLKAFRGEMISVVQNMSELRSLIEGNVEIGIEPPIATVGVAIQGLINEVESGDVEIAAGLLPCVVPAFEDAANILSNLAGDMQATIVGHQALFALLGNV